MIGIEAPAMTTRVSSGNIKSVIKTIREAVKPKQVQEFAKTLQGKSQMEQARAIYDFIIENIRYAKDALGTEEIRTPARTWADRHTGVDCEDYTIFSAAVGANIGLPVTAEIVDFGNGWAHIYPVAHINGMEVPFDPTPYPDGSQVPFNQRPPLVYKTMKIKLLEGMDGIEAVNPLNQLNRTQSVLKNLRAQGNTSPELKKEYRKCQYMKTLSGHDFTFGKIAMTYLVDDVPVTLEEFRPKQGIEQEDIAGLYHLLSGNFNEAEEVEILSGVDDETLELLGYADLSGIGKPKKSKQERKENRKKIFKKVGEGVKKATKKVGEGIKKVAKKAGEVVKKAVKFVKKVDPIMVSMRAAIRLALKINLFKITAKFKIAQIPRDEAIAKGVDPNEYDKLKKRYDEFLKTYEKLGGKPSEAEKAIRNAKVKKGPKVEGLGVAPAAAPVAAGVTAAVPLFKKIMDWLKGIDFKKMLGQAKQIKEMIPGAEEQPTDASDQEIENAFKQNEGALNAENDAVGKEMMTDDSKSPTETKGGKTPADKPDDSGKGGNMMLYLGIAAAGLAIVLLK